MTMPWVSTLIRKMDTTCKEAKESHKENYNERTKLAIKRNKSTA